MFKSFILCAIVFLHLQFDLSGQERKPSKTQQDFVSTMLPVIKQVNAEIASQRDFLESISQKQNQQIVLDEEERNKLSDLLKFYRVDVDGPIDSVLVLPKYQKELLMRVDIIPEKIALAQAAMESDWGRSRFAIEGNSYFGIRCRKPGCGIAPEGVANSDFYVRSFPTVYTCVRNYAQLLNIGKYYTDFRLHRAENRTEGEALDPLYLIEGLRMYSTKREAYIKSLRTIIIYNFGDI